MSRKTDICGLSAEITANFQLAEPTFRGLPTASEEARDSEPRRRVARGSTPPAEDTAVPVPRPSENSRRVVTVIRLNPEPEPVRACQATMVAPAAPGRFPRSSAAIPSREGEGDDGDADRRRFGDYEVVRKVAVGGMGVVFEGRHVRLGRRVAIKCMRKCLLDRPELSRRFLREAVAGANIGHPGVVDVLDFGHDAEDGAYLIMEYLDGQSLTDRLEEGELTLDEVVSFGVQIAETVGAAHEAGVVHRDLKPDNFFLVRDGSAPGGLRLKIFDFGVAKFLHDHASDPHKTGMGRLLGTPWYMAPEQCRGGGDVDTRSDIYALGCVLYQMACGRPPFCGGLGAVISAHLYEAPTPPHALNPDVPEALERLILEMMAKSPAERPQSMAAVEHRLANLHLEEEAARCAIPIRSTGARPAMARTIARRETELVVRQRRWPLGWIAAVLFALVAGGLFGAVQSGKLGSGGSGSAAAAAAAGPVQGSAR